MTRTYVRLYCYHHRFNRTAAGGEERDEVLPYWTVITTDRTYDSAQEQFRMLTVNDRHTIRAELSAVFDCVWNAELWPKITPHVKRVNIVESDADSQKMLMTVVSNGAEHHVESLRKADPQRRVTYTQTRPPAFLKAHSGEWHFDAVAEGVRVDLVHHAIVDYDKALPALNVGSHAEADAAISSMLKANGARTLLAIKDYLERQGGRSAE